MSTDQEVVDIEVPGQTGGRSFGHQKGVVCPVTEILPVIQRRVDSRRVVPSNQKALAEHESARSATLHVLGSPDRPPDVG